MWEDPEEALMFHLQSGFYFEKAGDKVRILLNRDGVVSAALVTRSEFASAIAYVSERGESRETHDEAERLLSRAD
jgi:hypothetical protein